MIYLFKSQELDFMYFNYIAVFSSKEEILCAANHA